MTCSFQKPYTGDLCGAELPCSMHPTPEEAELAALNATTWSATIGGIPLRLTVEFDGDGKPVDVTTAGCGLPGSSLDGLWRCFVKVWDMNLKSGKVPVERLLTLVGRGDLEHHGSTNDPLCPFSGGLGDYFARSYLVRIGRADLLVAPEEDQ